MSQSDVDIMENDERGKIFVGGLSWETTHANLMQYFSRFGEVVDCVVMKNSETGRSRGFGFVTFARPAIVNVVLTNGPHTLDGRTIDPKPCNPRTLQKPKKGSGYPKVFLGGLNANVTETDLRSFFSRYGRVMEVVIMYDQEKKKSRGFGFLSFESEESVNVCVAEHFVNVNGKMVEIKRAEPRNNSDDSSQSSHMDMINSPSYNQVGSSGVNQGWGAVPSNYPQGCYTGPSYGPAANTQNWDPSNSSASVQVWNASGYGVPQQSTYQQSYSQYNAPPNNATNWNNWNQELVSTSNNVNNNTSSFMAAGDMSARIGNANYSSPPSTKQAPGSFGQLEYTTDYQSAAGDNFVVGPVRVAPANYTYHPYRRS